MRYEPESMDLIQMAHTKARELGHSYVGSIHLLLAMLMQRGGTGQLLRGFGMEATVMEDMAMLLYGKGTAQLPLPQGFSADARQILQRAGTEAALRKERRVRPEHILISLTRTEKTEAAQMLYLSGIDANELFTRTLENMSSFAQLLASRADWL